MAEITDATGLTLAYNGENIFSVSEQLSPRIKAEVRTDEHGNMRLSVEVRTGEIILPPPLVCDQEADQ